MKKLYEKIFTREFTMPWLEIWYKGEAKTPKPWNNQLNKSFPYVVFIRHDDTVTSYYDIDGLNWSRNSTLNQVKKDKNFIQEIKSHVISDLEYINNYLSKKVILDKEELLLFLDLFQSAYRWLLPMWEIGESDLEKLVGLNVSQILELKKSTVTLTDDLDNLIRESLRQIYSNVAEYSQVLTIEEIRSDKIPSLEELRRRAKGFIFTNEILFRPEQLELVESKYNIKLNLSHSSKKITHIKGNAASLGCAKGLVRKVMALKHMNDFKKGEILVSPMTMPDFVPVMKKSAAIITDEGGITCHAAIIAREFKKPCIVGTKNASEVLQNGDLVEVNADKGIVTILK